MEILICALVSLVVFIIGYYIVRACNTHKDRTRSFLLKDTQLKINLLDSCKDKELTQYNYVTIYKETTTRFGKIIKEELKLCLMRYDDDDGWD